MARQLENGKTRIVISGPTNGPTQMTAEYRVINGDMGEQPKRVLFDGTDFDSTVSELWQSAMGQSNAAEEIS